MRVSLFFCGSPVQQPGIQHACMMDSWISHRPDHIAGSNAAFDRGHHFRTLYKINAYIIIPARYFPRQNKRKEENYENSINNRWK